MPVRRAGKLNNLSARLDVAIKRGLIESGMVVAQTASQKAPVDTGRLMRSITYGRPEKMSKTGYEIDVGTNVEYAATQEFGSGIYGESGMQEAIKRESKRGIIFFVSGVKAQPYLRPALFIFVS